MSLAVENDRVVFYQYNPSREAGLAFVALFGLSTVGHFCYMFPLRAWHFIPFILGGICEAFGFYGRALAHNNKDGLGAWAMQMLLILAAPVFLCATIYMTLGRIIRALDADHHSMIRVRWLTKIYVLLDILIFCSQIGGAGVQITGDPKVMAIGMKAVMGGLIFQLIALAFFIAIAARVHVRLNREPSELSLALSWRKYMWAIYISGVAILVRSLIRVVEYGEGAYGAVATHEIYLYVFDAFLMWVLMMVVLVVHPGQLIKTSMRRIAGIYSGGDRDSAAIGLTDGGHEMKMTSV